MKINRFIKVINEPKMLWIYLKSKIFKEKLYKDFQKKTFKNGLEGLKFILSFDCDTEEDIAVVEEVNKRLLSIGIKAVYAVPGQLIEKGYEVYSRILNAGSEFMNHGYLVHTIKKNGVYRSTLDYHKMSIDEVKEDIVNGDKFLREEFGITPIGFRTPHFGHFQSRKHLKFLFSTLKSLDYKYSSSTIPYFALKNGSVYRNQVLEFPMTGLVSEPLRIFDSFLFYNNESGFFDGQRYYEEGHAIAEFYRNNIENGIINIYADPSQIANSDEFFNLMEEFVEIAENTTYKMLIDKMELID